MVDVEEGKGVPPKTLVIKMEKNTLVIKKPDVITTLKKKSIISKQFVIYEEKD